MPIAARVLGPGDLVAARHLCALDPVDSVMAAARIDLAARRGLPAAGGELWGWPGAGPLQAICWVGANLVPVIPRRLSPADRQAAATAFAELAVRRRRRSSSIAGERTVVLQLWRHLSAFWPKAREVRPDQPSMSITRGPQVEADRTVRLVQPIELDTMLPACIDMFTEEVGFSPIVVGGDAFRDQVRTLIMRGQAYVRRRSEVEFKAEVGVVAGGVAQVQGVWIPPHLRGRGMSAPALAAVVADAQHRLAPTISLYANAHNERALRCYRRVGFEQVGTFATVLF